MRKIVDIGFCGAFSSEEFLLKLDKVVTEFQKNGCEVDIQYAPTKSGQLTALVTAYKGK